MRKLILALTALVSLTATVSAQQAPSFSLYGPIPPGSNAIGSVLADLRVAGSPVTPGNPVPIGGTVALGAGSATIGSVNVLGGNTAAVKTDGSGTTQPVSAAALPLPSGAATAANQSSEISALGGTADAAYAGSGASSIIAALKGVYNATLAPLAAGSNLIGKVGIDQTTPGTTNGVVVNTSALPSGAATAANQANEVAQLTAIATKMVNYTDTNGNVAASGTSNSAVHDAGAPATFSRANTAAYSQQGGTLTIQACGDSACSSYFVIQQIAVAAGSTGNLTAPLPTRYWRTTISNASSSAASGSIVYSSMTAN